MLSPHSPPNSLFQLLIFLLILSSNSRFHLSTLSFPHNTSNYSLTPSSHSPPPPPLPRCGFTHIMPAIKTGHDRQIPTCTYTPFIKSLMLRRVKELNNRTIALLSLHRNSSFSSSSSILTNSLVLPHCQSLRTLDTGTSTLPVTPHVRHGYFHTASHSAR